MIGTLLTLAVCAITWTLARVWWRHFLNPVSFSVLAWAPALVLLNWPPYFIYPYYWHLNRPIGILLYTALALACISFWLGCATAKAMSKPGSFDIVPSRLVFEVKEGPAIVLFVIGFLVFVYSYVNSGLMDMANLDVREIAESQRNLYIGRLTFLTFFMDIVAIAFLAQFVWTRKVIYLAPLLIALACEAATLQKSLLMLVVSAAIFVFAINPSASYQLFWKTPMRRLLFGALILGLVVGLISMNAARKHLETRYTATSFPLHEELYIYTGSSAIVNLSNTIEGYLSQPPPAMGVYLAKPVLWYVIDRSYYDEAAQEFGGINTGTYLLEAWADFRWFGFFIWPFLTGVAVMLFLRLGLSGTLTGLLFGAVAVRAVIFSPSTEVIFEPATWIILAQALFADFLIRKRPSAGYTPRRYPPPPGRVVAPRG